MFNISQELSNESLGTFVNSAIREQLKSMHVAHPGIINSFNKTTRLATVKLVIQKVFNETEKVDIPLLINVPVIMLNGGGFNVTLPIKPGDECLVVFCDRAIDNWVMRGQVAPPITNRIHDINDGVAIIGGKNQAKQLPNYMDDGIEIRSDDGKTRISAQETGQIEVENEDGIKISITPAGKIQIINKTSGDDLVSLLKQLSQAVSEITVASIQIDNKAAIIDITNKINNFKL